MFQAKGLLRLDLFVTPVVLLILAGCGGSSSKTAPVTATVAEPQFSPAAGVYSTTQNVTISDSTTGSTIYYTTDGTVPTASSAKYSGPIAVAGSQTIQALATAPSATSSAVVGANFSIVPPVVNAASFDFGQDLLNTTLTKTVGSITNNGPTAAPVALSISGDASFSLVGGQSCPAQIPANSTCSVVVAYDPTKPGAVTGTVSAQFTGGTTTPSLIQLMGTAAAGTTGTVSKTINPQVALYSLTAPFNGGVTVEFGPTTSYGLSTSSLATPPGGGQVQTLVAGMLANTLYHMRAVVQFANGQKFTDSDHEFTTGALPSGVVPTLTATTATGMTPQPGIELINDILGPAPTGAIATDLAGNVIWTYVPKDRQQTSILYPIKLLPNGHMIMEVNPVSQSIVSGPTPPGTLDVLREIDLAGNVIHDLTMTDLNQRLATAGFTGLTLQVFSHDVTPLPNGHMLVIANTIKPFTNVTGFPGTTQVVGDVVVDLDTDMNPVWVWNEFDHFDVNRHPMGFPDWTHSNAVTYSPDDGNFLVSIRHQNWVVKVNYQNGTGDGSVLWKLGYQGDFKLIGGTDPTDWFYAQHNPSFFSSSTSGVFSLGLMDNGNDRAFPDGTNCLTAGGSHCYTTIPVLQVDETAKTATLTSHQILPTSLYSSFAGDTFLLDNGNTEYNLAGVGAGSVTYEVTPGSNPQTVWTLQMPTEHTYRAFRIPSLYPGVSW